MSAMLEEANRRLAARSRSALKNYVGRSATREAVAWTVALLASAAAVIAISLAMKYAGTIAISREVDTTDRYGQLLDKKITVARASVDTLARSVIDPFIKNCFNVVNSSTVMKENAQACLATSNQPVVKGIIKAYWATHSPLSANGHWTPPTAETFAKVTSLVSRGQGPEGTEYQVQFTLTSVDISSGVGTEPALHTSDFILDSNGVVSDSNLGGLNVAHFDFTEMH